MQHVGLHLATLHIEVGRREHTVQQESGRQMFVGKGGQCVYTPEIRNEYEIVVRILTKCRLHSAGLG